MSNKLYGIDAEAVKDKIRYDMFFVKKGWDDFEKDTKQEMCKSLKDGILQLGKTVTIDGCRALLKDCFCSISTASKKERINLIHFYANTQFFGSLFRKYAGISSQRLKNAISEDNIRDFLEAASDIDEYIEIICHIYVICPDNIKDELHEMIDYGKSIFSYNTLVHGLFTGALNYDAKVRMKFMEQIKDTKYSESSAANVLNPGFVLAKLYLYNFVDTYELEKYKDICMYNNLLSFIIYPDFIPAEKEWSFLKERSEYRKYFQDRV